MDKNKYKTLRKYIELREIEVWDMRVLEECARGGLVTMDYTQKVGLSVARVNEKGHYALREEELRRSPLKRLMEKVDVWFMKGGP